MIQTYKLFIKNSSHSNKRFWSPEYKNYIRAFHHLFYNVISNGRFAPYQIPFCLYPIFSFCHAKLYHFLLYDVHHLSVLPILHHFFDQYDVVCNPDYYCDDGHYNAEINSRILGWIANDTGLVTKENYLEKLAAEREFNENYDYDSIYE